MKGINTKAIVFVACVFTFVALAAFCVNQLLMVSDYKKYIQAEKDSVRRCVISSDRAPAEDFYTSISVCVGISYEVQALEVIAKEVNSTNKLTKDQKDRLAIKLQRAVFKLNDVVSNAK